MSNNIENYGPLTPEQHEEMLRHPLRDEPLWSLEDDIKYYSNILTNTPETDPVHCRMTAQLNATRRALNLLTRFATYGVSEIVELSDVFETRR